MDVGDSFSTVQTGAIKYPYWLIAMKSGGSVASAAAALLLTTLSQRLSTRQSELYSEILCWSILPLLFRLGDQFAIKPAIIGSEKAQGMKNEQFDFHFRAPNRTTPLTLSRPLLFIALGVVTTTLYRTELPFIQLYRVQRYDDAASGRTDSASGAFHQFSLLRTTLIALFSTLALPNVTLRESALSAFPTIALVFLYAALKPRGQESQTNSSQINFEDEITSISRMVVLALLVVLGVHIAVFGLPESQLLPVLISGVMKAMSWKFSASTADFSSWRIATSIATFGLLANVDPLSHDSEVRALPYIIASLLVIHQIIHMLPKTALYKSILWTFALLPIISYVAARSDIVRAEVMARRLERSGVVHPVESLIADARSSFETLVKSQSKTFDAACAEYRRRYRMNPPPGFEEWYEFAVSHHSPIIDNFDTIHHSVSPFWRQSGREIRRAMKEAYGTTNSELWQCSFSGDSAKTVCDHAQRSFDRHITLEFHRLMGSLKGKLGDVRLLVNHFDEAAVLIPPPGAQSGGYHGRDLFRMEHMSKTPIGQLITKHCEPKSLSGDKSSSPYADTYGLPFVVNQSAAMNLCQQPQHSHLHGFLMSPTSFRLFEGLVPILSTGSPSVMGDVLFPSPAYAEAEFQYEESHDMDWEKKRNVLYWTGSTTGGYAHDEHWPHYHRQRFVSLVQNPNGKQVYRYLDQQGGKMVPRLSSFLNRRLYNVGFTNVVGCDRKHCRDQRAYFDLKSWADKDEALGSRLVFDIDGNGISGRYYKLLASRSAPLKMTIFREWHDDRLVPWYHYIPVSLGMEELPELMMYLTSTEAGQRRAKEIADQGREWYLKAFRDVDKTIYLYRLILELARLEDPEREARGQ